MKKILAGLFMTIALSTGIFAQKKADIMFMHDIHSFLKNLSKAKTLIDEQRIKNPDTILVDGGDFSMGTLYQTIFETQAPDLRMLGALEFDAFTIGNHEFDYGVKALANMLDVARASKENVPEFVLCNVDWTKDNDYTRTLKAAFDRYGLNKYIMLHKEDLNVAIIGVFGEDAFFCSPTCELTFTNQYEAVKEVVAEIKAKENADLIICLSHGGTWDDQKKSEDEILAKKVPELDVIVSAHTHTVLEKPIIRGDTIIVSAGAYSEYLGNLSLTQKENGRWQLDEYRLDSLNGDIIRNPKIERDLARYDRYVNEEYLNNYGYTSSQVLTKSKIDYDINHEVGYLMADAIFDSVTKIGEPVDIVVVPEGVTRGTFKKGEVTVSDVFEAYSLGVGEDKLAGYPLVSIYFTGKELKEIAEIDCSLSKFVTYVRLYTSGVKYEYNPRRLLMDKVTAVYMLGKNGVEQPVEPEKLYCVVTDMYTAQMIGSIINLTHGLVSILPKNRYGEPIEDFKKEILTDSFGREQKGWVAIARYLENFRILPVYSEAERKAIVACPSLNPVKLLGHPTKIGIILRVVILFVILLFAGIVVLLVFVIKKIRAKSKKEIAQE